MFQPFGEALFGAAHTNAYATILTAEGKIAQVAAATTASPWSSAAAWIFQSARSIQIRPVEVDYLGTHFGANHVASYSAWQNNFKYVAGVNFTFGGK